MTRLLFILCFWTFHVIAAPSINMVVRFQLSPEDQKKIETLAESQGLKRLPYAYHVTVLYLKDFPSTFAAEEAGKKITEALKDQQVDFVFDKVAILKKRFLTLSPTSESLQQLKKINETAYGVAVHENYPVGSFSTPEMYIPHITLSYNKQDAGKIEAVQNALAKEKHIFKLHKVSYVVFERKRRR